MKTDLRELELNAFMEQADSIARMIHTPEWQVWERLIMAFRAESLENLANADAESVRYWQGAVAAIKVLLERPHEIVDAAVEAHAENDKDDVRRSLEMAGGHLEDEV